MSDLVVRGASVWRDSGWAADDLWIRGGVVAEPGDAVPAADVAAVDGSGLLAAPGFVDLQCNGALGIDLASEPERLWELGAQLLRWGVTAWLPTIVTTPPGVVDRALTALAAGAPDGWVGAVPLGLHLEGPFLAPDKRGAHPRSLLRAPDLTTAAAWSRAAGVALVTLAPELDGALDVLRGLVARGVVVSLGHSAATVEEARGAVDAGASWVTHLFNAMSPLHHREPGLAGAALTDERLHVGLIADGVHVHPTAVALAQRALGGRLVLVTDSVAALGMPPGEHALGRATVVVDANAVRLPDGTLAGSNLSLDQAVRNLVTFTGCEPALAVGAASAAPARVLGDGQRGTLRPGARGDVVLLTPSLTVAATIVGGEIAFDAR
jgi:N-acetylglucosamine-6-phosphate deacetylase